jgi:hypothetical protein
LKHVLKSQERVNTLSAEMAGGHRDKETPSCRKSALARRIRVRAKDSSSKTKETNRGPTVTSKTAEKASTLYSGSRDGSMVLRTKQTESACLVRLEYNTPSKKKHDRSLDQLLS